MSVSVCTILDTNAPASWSVGRTALWGILLDGVRYLERRYQYNKWWFGTAHSENVPGQDWTDHHSSETKEVKCGRKTLSCLTRYMNYIGTWLKLSHGSTRSRSWRIRCVNRTEIRLSLWYYTQGSAQIGRKAMLVDVRRWS